MESTNEAFILALMADKNLTRDEAINRCVSVVRAFCGDKYSPPEKPKTPKPPAPKPEEIGPFPGRPK